MNDKSVSFPAPTIFPSTIGVIRPGGGRSILIREKPFLRLEAGYGGEGPLTFFKMCSFLLPDIKMLGD